jgi:mRNA-degrading endonuclease RelE of RelBE toxin-antitoxin system
VKVRVELYRRAKSDLANLNPRDREAILRALDLFAVGSPTLDLLKLKGRRHNDWRLRVGLWRIILRRDDQVTFVLRVVRRSERTYSALRVELFRKEEAQCGQ